jgi:hypothetical protein
MERVRIMDEVMSAIEKFLIAQREAEKNGEETFICPLCGGSSWWGRAQINNHLHCGCKKCGFGVMQ